MTTAFSAIPANATTVVHPIERPDYGFCDDRITIGSVTDGRAISIQLDGRIIIVRPAKPDEIVDLRHRVLRAGLPRNAAVFPGDELTTSIHVGAFDEKNHAVCCGTFHRSQWENAPAWQLRGMATDDRVRGRGLGAAVLQLCEKLAGDDPVSIRQLWCNARILAVPFYRRAGWQVVSEQFEIPTAGIHFRMSKELQRG